jgi:outer membrane protein TolC
VPYAYGALRAARLSERSNAASFEVTESSVLLSVAETFYTAAGADELVRARQNAVSVANQTWQDAKSRVAAGFVNAVEATRAEVSLVRAGQDEAEAENTRSSVYRSLRTLLGVHEGVVVAPTRTTPSPAPSVPALVEQARSLRPEFAEYRTAVESANATESSNAWRWAPTLAGFGTARLSNYRGFAGDKYAWAVGAELDWTLYDGGTRDAERRRASADARENSARLEQLAESIADEVANAAGTLETKWRALDAAKHAQDLSEDTLRIVRAQYAAGTASELDVLDAQDSFVSAEVALVRAHFDFSLADLELQKAAGLFPPKSAP